MATGKELFAAARLIQNACAGARNNRYHPGECPKECPFYLERAKTCRFQDDYNAGPLPEEWDLEEKK